MCVAREEKASVGNRGEKEGEEKEEEKYKI